MDVELIVCVWLDGRWLDSSLSIMEQGVREFSTLLLRYKFYSFYDLNAKYDAVRINQIYEQAKWQLLNEEIDCTEEEMLMFGALQLQINLQSAQPQPLDSHDNEDDIDAALSDLQDTLEGTHLVSNSVDITQIPELSDFLRYMKYGPPCPTVPGSTIVSNRLIVFQAQAVHAQGLQALLVRVQGPAAVRVQDARGGWRRDARRHRGAARLRGDARRQSVAGQVRNPPRSARSGRHVGNVDPLRLGTSDLFPKLAR